MISLADLARLRANLATQVQPVAPVAFNVLRGVALGDEVRAQVIAALPGGLFHVLIENQSFTLRLPLDAKAGDVLPLMVEAREPQLRFALAARDEPTPATARLSETARLITTLLHESESLPPAAAARAAAPLLAGPPVTSAHVAAELKLALAQSGIFYESHQAQWVAGERSLFHLMKEPQASLIPLPGADDGQTLEPGAAGRPAAPSDCGPTPRAAEGAVHRDASAIVRQQLDTLATQHVVWNGQVWPGQIMHWEIAEQPRPQSPEPETREWSTNLQLTLPHLGEVSATLSFAGGGVTVKLHARSAEATATLARNGGMLEQSLIGAGIAPAEISVERNGAH